MHYREDGEQQQGNAGDHRPPVARAPAGLNPKMRRCYWARIRRLYSHRRNRHPPLHAREHHLPFLGFGVASSGAPSG